jgi:hypothetical protein
MKRHAHIIIPLGLTALVFVLFGKTLGNRFNSDDYLVVYHASQATYTLTEAAKEFLRPSWGLYYRPGITLFFNALESWFGIAPEGYHLVSLMLYSALCIEVYFLGIALGQKISVALAAALIFMTMTAHAEALFWISSLNGVVENVFSLASLTVFIMWRRRSKKGLYILALLLFIAALFVKESAVALPAVLILYDALLGGEFAWPEAARRAVRSAWPFVLAGALFVIVREMVMRQVEFPPPLTSFELRTSLIGLWHSLLMTLLPIDWALAVNWFNALEAGGAFFYAFAAAGILLIAAVPFVLKKNRIAFFLGWIFTGAAPVIGLGLTPSERHVVFSSAAAAFLIAIFLFILAERITRRFSFSSAVIGFALILSFSAANFFFLNQRRIAWRTASEIAADTVETTMNYCPAPAPDATFFFLNVPDTYDGAFVFRFNNLAYALRLHFKIPSLNVVRIVTPERISPKILSNPTYAYFRISAMGGNVFLGDPEGPSRMVNLNDLPFLSRNSNYLDAWQRYSRSPFMVYSGGRLILSSPSELRKVLQDLYSLT